MSLGDGISLATFLILLFNFMQGKGNRTRINDVRDLVNGQSSKREDRIDQLTVALGDSGTKVPNKPNGEGHRAV